MRRMFLKLPFVVVASACALNPARTDLAKATAIVDEPRDGTALTAQGKPVDEQDWYALLGDAKAADSVARSRAAAGTDIGFGMVVVGAGLALGAGTVALVGLSDRGDASEKLRTTLIVAGAASAAVAAYGIYPIVANYPAASGGERVTPFESAHKAWAAARAPATTQDASVTPASTPTGPTDEMPSPGWNNADEFRFDDRRCHEGDAFPCANLAAEPTPVIWLDPSSAPPLFRDELKRVHAAAAAVLAKGETPALTFITAAEEARLRALSTQGRLRAGGPRCAAPPSETEVLREAYPGLAVARVSFSCVNECTATFTVSSSQATALEPKDELVSLHIIVADPTSEASWLEALAQSAPEPSARSIRRGRHWVRGRRVLRAEAVGRDSRAVQVRHGAQRERPLASRGAAHRLQIRAVGHGPARCQWPGQGAYVRGAGALPLSCVLDAQLSARSAGPAAAHGRGRRGVWAGFWVRLADERRVRLAGWPHLRRVRRGRYKTRHATRAVLQEPPCPDRLQPEDQARPDRPTAGGPADEGHAFRRTGGLREANGAHVRVPLPVA